MSWLVWRRLRDTTSTSNAGAKSKWHSNTFLTDFKQSCRFLKVSLFSWRFPRTGKNTKVSLNRRWKEDLFTCCESSECVLTPWSQFLHNRTATPQADADGDVYMNYASNNQAYVDLDPTSMSMDNVYSSLSWTDVGMWNRVTKKRGKKALWSIAGFRSSAKAKC